ncbi:unnamed protein product, partial [Musa hybrid cultivar]
MGSDGVPVDQVGHSLGHVEPAMRPARAEERCPQRVVGLPVHLPDQRLRLLHPPRTPQHVDHARVVLHPRPHPTEATLPHHLEHPPSHLRLRGVSPRARRQNRCHCRPVQPGLPHIGHHTPQQRHGIRRLSVGPARGDHGRPRGDAPAGHAVEHAAGRGEVAALGVHGDQGVGDEGVRVEEETGGEGGGVEEATDAERGKGGGVVESGGEGARVRGRGAAGKHPVEEEEGGAGGVRAEEGVEEEGGGAGAEEDEVACLGKAGAACVSGTKFGTKEAMVSETSDEETPVGSAEGGEVAGGGGGVEQGGVGGDVDRGSH